MGKVLHGSLLQLLLEHCNFLNIDISQGSVATRLRCGGIFKYDLVANLPMSLPVKEFWKSVNIWGSYGQEFGVLFFLRHSVLCSSPLLKPLTPHVDITQRLWCMTNAMPDLQDKYSTKYNSQCQLIMNFVYFDMWDIETNYYRVIHCYSTMLQYLPVSIIHYLTWSCCYKY